MDEHPAEHWESQYKKEQDARDRLRKKVAKILEAKGIRMSTSACGCCEGVSFKLEVDGKQIVDETHWNFSNIKGEEIG